MVINQLKRVEQYIANARYYLEAAKAFPSPTRDAAQILLLITGWENIILADQALNAWASEKDIDPRMLRDHKTKLKTINRRIVIEHVSLSSVEPRRPTTVKIYKRHNLHKLRQICMYGSEANPQIDKLLSEAGTLMNFKMLSMLELNGFKCFSNYMRHS